MTPPILYTFRRCPYAMRARMALCACGVEVEEREVSLQQKPAQMLAASPKGTVPVLAAADGVVIDESLKIMLWALAHRDPEGWLSVRREEQLALVAHNDGPFKHHLDRYKYAARFEGKDWRRHRAKGVKFLEILNRRLASAEYLFGEKRSLADIAIFPFVRQFRIADPDWFDALPMSPVRDWLASFVRSQLFESIMQKREIRLVD